MLSYIIVFTSKCADEDKVFGQTCGDSLTTSSVKEAKQIAQTLLKKRLVASINIVPCVHSKFWVEVEDRVLR